MDLAQDNDVIHALTPDRPDQPFGKAILPGRGWCGRLVFPQIAGLGLSVMAQRVSISSHAEATALLEHELLGPLVVKCARLVTAAREKTTIDILGFPDCMKLRSSLTLFDAVSKQEIFAEAITTFYPDGKDPATIEILRKMNGLVPGIRAE
jgi:uncharacterized protein (DUF1810 family)